MPTYGNGKVPRSAMKAFRNTGKYGHPDFIERLDQAFSAVQRELGVVLYIASGQDIFRDYEGQVYWRSYWAARGRPGNAALPGTSNHGLGVSADISPMPGRGTSSFKKIAAIFARYNLHFDVSTENWHVTDKNISVAGNQVTINGASSAFSGNSYFPSVDSFRILQEQLNFIGYALATDGHDGPKTRAAASDFQRKHGLPVDGVIGHATQAQIVVAVNQKHAQNAAAAAAAAASKPRPIADVVRDQQTRLNVWGAATPPLAVDGIPGPRFKKATEVFQKAHGLAVDGNIGPKTWAKLLETPPAKPLTIQQVVRNQQARLNAWGAMTPPLALDGIPGPKFEQATRIFQKAHGFVVDGKIGPKTWALLVKNPGDK